MIFFDDFICICNEMSIQKHKDREKSVFFNKSIV